MIFSHGYDATGCLRERRRVPRRKQSVQQNSPPELGSHFPARIPETSAKLCTNQEYMRGYGNLAVTDRNTGCSRDMAERAVAHKTHALSSPIRFGAEQTASTQALQCQLLKMCVSLDRGFNHTAPAP